MPVNCLYSPIGFRYKEFGVNEFLYGENDTVFYFKAYCSARVAILIDTRLNWITGTHPEFSTALVAYST